MKVALILLAAGQSRRMGSDKLLMELEGKTLLDHCAETAKQTSADEFIAVIGPGQAGRAKLLSAHGFRCVVNERADEGLSTSIAAGVSASIAEGYVLALADMPLVPSSHLEKVVSALRKGHKVVATKGEFVGPPAGFHCEYQADLVNLKGDAGAKALIKQSSTPLIALEAKFLKDFDQLTDFGVVQ